MVTISIPNMVPYLTVPMAIIPMIVISMSSLVKTERKIILVTCITIIFKEINTLTYHLF